MDFQEAEFLREAEGKDGKSDRSHSPFPLSALVEAGPAKHLGAESATEKFM